VQLSEKQITDFQKLYKKHFGKNISKKEALEKGLYVLNIVKQMAKASSKLRIIENE
jgi:hypothetical protein